MFALNDSCSNPTMIQQKEKEEDKKKKKKNLPAVIYEISSVPLMLNQHGQEKI